MKKNLIKLASLLLGSVLLGAGTASVLHPGVEVDAASGDSVNFAAGSYSSTDKTITWTLDSLITITQNQGQSATLVSGEYIEEPRAYKGHYFLFSAIEGVSINTVMMTTSRSGSDITYWSVESGTVTVSTSENKPTSSDVGGATVNNMTSSKSMTFDFGSASEAIIQNSYVEASQYTQLRPTTISITYTSSIQVVTPTSVTVSLDASTLTSYNATTQATATVLPENATDKSVNWSSSNEDVATVDKDGVVTAIGNGTANITATCVADDTVFGSAPITVEVTQSYIESDIALDVTSLGIDDSSYANNNGAHAVGQYSITTYDVMESNTTEHAGKLQMRSNSGYIRNTNPYFGSVKTISISILGENVPVVEVGETSSSLTTLDPANELRNGFSVYEVPTGTTAKFFQISAASSTTYLSAIVVELNDDNMTNVREFAKTFNDTLEPLCTALEGIGAETWATLETAYNKLTDAEKAVVVGASKTYVATDLAECVKRYDYIVAKYTTLNKFIAREVESSALNFVDPTANSSILMIALFGLSALVVTVGATIVIARRRKHN